MATVTATTVVLVDWPSDLARATPLRVRVTHTAGDRAGLVAGLAGALPGVQTSWLSFLVAAAADRWVPAAEFEALRGPLSRVLRCIVSDDITAGGEDKDKPSAVLMLPWRRFGDVTFGTGLASDLIVQGHRVRLPTSKASSSDDVHAAPHGATGRTLWDGAVLLATYLDAHPEVVRGRTVVELGAGQGLAGVCAALCGASKVTLTDLPYALEGCKDTVKLNSDAIVSSRYQHFPPDIATAGAGMESTCPPGAGAAVATVDSIVAVEALDWFNPPRVRRHQCQAVIGMDNELLDGTGNQINKGAVEVWDVVLAADVVWLQELVEAFVDTLAALLPPSLSQPLTLRRESGSCSDSNNRLVLLSYQRRGLDADKELWQRLAEHGFQVEGPLPFEPPVMNANPAASSASAAAAKDVSRDQPRVMPRDMAGSHVELGLFRITRLRGHSE